MIPSGVTPRVRAHALLEREWDAIVVGAGVGGLVCAGLLASRGRMRVLVLERHHEIGGLTQSFRRKRYAWEVGVHYVGDVGSGKMLRRMLDVTTGGRLDWARLPARHDRWIAPGIDARLGGDRAALRAQWLSIAPGEERAADRILDAVVECARLAPPHLLGRMRRRAIASAAFLALSDRTTAEVLAECGASPRLAAAAAYCWTDYGTPPATSSFAAHAITLAHYLEGAFHPIGGGAALASGLAAQLAANGSAVVCRAEVAHVTQAFGRASGVALRDGTLVRAPIVVSDVGARGTYERLAPDAEAASRALAIGPSSSHVALYLGLAAPPSALGLDGANLFVQRDAPGDAPRDAEAWAEGRASEPPDLFLSSACAVDPSFAARYPGRSALTAATPVSLARFAAFDGTERGHRGREYESIKEHLADGMLRVLGRHVPLAALEHAEISTPLSTRHFTAHPSGEIYGLAPTPLRFREGPGPHTSLSGLFLTGQDVWTCGVAGAASGGLLTACAITQRDLPTELALR